MLGRRAVSPTGRMGASAALPSGDSLTSMLSPPAWGSLARAFLPLEGCHDEVLMVEGVLSVDVVRDNGSCVSMVRLGRGLVGSLREQSQNSAFSRRARHHAHDVCPLCSQFTAGARAIWVSTTQWTRHMVGRSL